MRKIHAFFLLLLILSAAGAQLFSESIGLITDEYWNAMLEEQLESEPVFKIKKYISEFLPVNLTDTFRVEGKKIKKHIVYGSSNRFDQGELLSAVEESRASVLIISPLLDSFAVFLAESEPSRTFLVPVFEKEGKGGDEELPKNLIFLELDYSDACREAGIYAASMNLDTSAVFFSGNSCFESFMAGWNTVRKEEDLTVTRFSDPDNISEDDINHFTGSVIADKGTAVVFAGPHTGTYLSGFESSSVKVVTENLQSWRFTGFSAAASVELTALKIVSDAVKISAAGNYGDGKKIKAEFFSYHQ